MARCRRRRCSHLMAAAMIYFLVNSLAVAGAFGLSTGRSAFRVWHDNFLWTISSYVVGSIAAGIAVELFRSAGQWQTAARVHSAGPDLSNLSHLPQTHCR